MKYKRLAFKDFMSIYHKVPRAAVDVIVKTKDGIVLTKRSIEPFKGMWHIPGGTVLFKEPIAHAINRVSQEELGVKVNIIELLGVNEYFNDGGRHTICNVYLTKIVKGEIKGSHQGKSFDFFKKIPNNIIPEQKTFLKKYCRKLLKSDS